MDCISFLIVSNNLNQSISAIICHYWDYDRKKHEISYKKILASLLRATKYLRYIFDKYQYSNCSNYQRPGVDVRIGRFGAGWDAKSNYPGFYEEYRSEHRTSLKKNDQ